MLQAEPIMSNDATTKPTIETVLERIDKLGESLTAQINLVRDDIRELERRMDVMSIDLNKLRAEVRRLDDRIDKLEKQPV
jgi:predicted  nucleic acid-binding Zn-ribbon protein